ncbi:MAG: arabinan endo-1,5-alpha-L-arabinosidase [Prevotella sp.]|jgi:beta-xylosidase|nr:arabinan endo-1,5-alpha-L-arabinosidase [Prevotella sp.]MCH3970169.1 arabinan endo-1,5-alpha-L-arabinosidase [Prevotella sp.]MCI1685685.1 arabinan endo-1,5-alpha-L-arabinosidase [Prevotella sp.]MCI1781523.1 arabinan endo-1,5-alpha-L-arabinosidase [Prevotella sp.]MCI1802034.1 arabinan endo-1,5-alpha-L-arabinosidase [Prevotella sp.]MCI2137430.1 arabinan endo-1,5-alpha-L-arabinosidase [Prevotella sp.]
MKKISFLALILLSVFSFAACSSSNPDNNNGGTGNDNPGSEYTVPTYEDYYVGFSDWNNRAKWNLANVHDPTVVLADDGYYYMYQTDASYGNVHEGHGHFFCRRSKDLVNWEFLGATMHGIPSWVETKLNEIRSNMGLGASTANFNDQTQFGFWAPCVRRISSNLYRMYYVITIPGTIDGNGTWSERCFIGLMETSNPADIDSWKDKGYVITNYSDKQLNFHVSANDWNNCYFKYNAIDPSLIITDSGENWLIYGSWHSGIAAVQLNPSTGMPLKELGNPWGDENAAAYGKTVYNRFLGKTGQRWQGSEAPEVVYHNGYYYLFLAYDELSVAYNTRVVRSKNIDGPYYDITGRNVTSEGGEAYPIVTHPYKFGIDHGWVGISHCAIFDDGKGNWYYVSQQRFPANFNGNISSNALMMGGIRSIVWTSSGWPLVLPERYGAVPQKTISESELVGNWQHINLVYSYQKQDASTTMVLGSDYTVKSGWSVGSRWSFDATSNVLTIGTVKLYLKREVDWEASPRKATIVYVGLSSDGKTTYWGKKVD